MTKKINTRCIFGFQFLIAARTWAWMDVSSCRLHKLSPNRMLPRRKRIAARSACSSISPSFAYIRFACLNRAPIRHLNVTSQHLTITKRIIIMRMDFGWFRLRGLKPPAPDRCIIGENFGFRQECGCGWMRGLGTPPIHGFRAIECYSECPTPVWMTVGVGSTDC